MAVSTIVSLPQMVDLALGSPEVGAVNFNILHSLLHVMIQQMELQQCAVEFRGADSDRIQTALSASATAAPKLSEYHVRDRSRRDKEIAKAQESKEKTPAQTQGTLPVPVPTQIPPQTQSLLPGVRSETRRRRRSKPRIDPSSSGSSSSLSGSRRPPRRSCSKDEHEERSGRRRSYSTHVLHALASVKGLGRLSEDLASLQSQVDGQDSRSNTAAVESRKTLELSKHSDLATRALAVETGLNELMAQGEEAVQRLKTLEDAFSSLSKSTGVFEIRTCYDDMDPTSWSHHFSGLTEDALLVAIRDQLVAVAQTVACLKGRTPAAAGDTDTGVELRGRLEEHAAAIGDLRKQLETLQADLRVAADGVSAVSRQADDAAKRVVQPVAMRLEGFQADLDSLVTHVGTLFRERDRRENAVNALRVQVEALDERKADRWTLESALADKADRGIVSTKVSQAEFTAACSGLQLELGEARTKLDRVEGLFEAKVEKSELPAVAYDLAERVERMERIVGDRAGATTVNAASPAGMGCDPYISFAAGTKSRLLRNVNCISCDAPAVMRCEEWCPPVPCTDGFPERQSARPYLLRRRAHSSVERTDRIVTYPRYCGGIHTTKPSVAPVTGTRSASASAGGPGASGSSTSVLQSVHGHASHTTCANAASPSRRRDRSEACD